MSEIIAGRAVMGNAAIDKNELELALCKKFGSDVSIAGYEAERLHGGTIVDVLRVTGNAVCGGETLPFCMVYKTQKVCAYTR